MPAAAAEQSAADTIFALASGSAPSAIAVMRISGPAAGETIDALCGTRPPPRRASLRALRSADGEILDRALVLWFPGPATATGEDAAELHLHGGRAVVRAVEAVLASMPRLRRAGPGEFTRRALFNGVIDLSEAEGLADLVAAETQAARRQALSAAGGAVRDDVERIGAALLDLAARIEAAIEFGEDEADVDASFDHRPAVRELIGMVEARLARPPAERLRDGIRVTIAGPPNAGKSSLLNRLVDREVAIVTAIPGTTRDIVEVPVMLGGTAFLFSDTAGLRESQDMVEAIGIERARHAIAVADLVVWLGDPADAPAGALLVRSKADLGGETRPGGVICVSSLTGAGIAALVTSLVEAGRGLLPTPDEIAFNERQRAVLAGVGSRLIEAEDAPDPIILAELIHQARRFLDQITGRHGVDDLLGALFSSMCIGK